MSTVLVVEKYEACDDALGKMVLYGVYVGQRRADVVAAVLAKLEKDDRAGWSGLSHQHPDKFFSDRARIEFDRDWRVRAVQTNTILGKRPGDP
jgi:hypothetical protein